MKEALLVDFRVQGDSPIWLAITIPIPSSEEGCNIVHLLHHLRRVGEVIAHFLLELRLVFRVVENVPAVIEDLTIAVEENAIKLALPGIERSHGGYPVFRGPIRILWVLPERLYLDNVRLLWHKKVAIEPGSSHIGVIPMDGLQIREDLRVKRLARDLTHVDHSAGLFFPQRHPMFEAVANRALWHQDIDSLAFVRLVLQKRDTLLGDRRFI